jgi:TonB family protein
VSNRVADKPARGRPRDGAVDSAILDATERSLASRGYEAMTVEQVAVAAGVSILRSSGHKLIDDAAVRIVHLAAPFAPFPPDIRADTDIVHITRTWRFNDTLSSER